MGKQVEAAYLRAHSTSEAELAPGLGTRVPSPALSPPDSVYAPKDATSEGHGPEAEWGALVRLPLPRPLPLLLGA